PRAARRGAPRRGPRPPALARRRRRRRGGRPPHTGRAAAPYPATARARERRAFRQIPHALLGATAVLGDINVENLGDAVVGLQIARDHTHGCSLARAVVAEKASDLDKSE